MSDLSAYSECLSLLEAKKLLALMQKPGKGGSWMDWSGEGGAEMNKKITEQMVYPAYEIRYSYLGPRDWKDREKSRKKRKKPIREQVGTLTLENGSVAEVCLVIEKEGYVFSLLFGSDEDVIKFSHSKLFQKTKWHSGAE